MNSLEIKKYQHWMIRVISLLFLELGFACAGELPLPKPTGPYSIGTKAIEVHDPSRTNFRDKNSRRWMVQAYYPSEKHEGSNPYMPRTLEAGIVQGTNVFAWAKPDAKPLLSQKFSILIFVPGLGEERQKYTVLLEELASQGYIVLAVDQPYVANFVKFPDGTTRVLTCKDVWKVPRDRNYRYQYYDDAMAGSIQDIKYLLSHLEEMNVSELGGLCDANHITLMGHSFGGNVAHTLGFEDERVQAIVDIDSKITERQIFGRVGVPPNPAGKPVLFIRGMMQYQEDVGDQLTKIRNATIWSPFVQHSAFSDQAYFAANIPDFGKQGFFSNLFNWFFKRGPHWDCIDTNLGGADVDAWVTKYRRSIVEWLHQYREERG